MNLSSSTYSTAMGAPYACVYNFARHEIVSVLGMIHFHCDVTPTEETFMTCLGYVGTEETPCGVSRYDLVDDVTDAAMTDLDVSNVKAMEIAMKAML